MLYVPIISPPIMRQNPCRFGLASDVRGTSKDLAEELGGVWPETGIATSNAVATFANITASESTYELLTAASSLLCLTSVSLYLDGGAGGGKGTEKWSMVIDPLDLSGFAIGIPTKQLSDSRLRTNRHPPFP